MKTAIIRPTFEQLRGLTEPKRKEPVILKPDLEKPKTPIEKAMVQQMDEMAGVPSPQKPSFEFLRSKAVVPATGPAGLSIPEIADPNDVSLDLPPAKKREPVTKDTTPRTLRPFRGASAGMTFPYTPNKEPFNLGILEISKAIRELVAPTTPYTEKEAIKAYKEIPRTLENAGMRVLTLGGLAGPLMGLKPSELRAALDEDVRDSAGFGGALAPALGETALLAVEWGYIYPKLFKAVGAAPVLIAKIPGVAKGANTLKALGGIEKIATKYPRLYNKASKGLAAFTKGATVGTITALPEALGEELPAGEVLKHTGKSAAIMGGIALAFQTLSSLDTARYVKQLRNSLIKASNQRFTVRIAELKSTLPPRQANEAIKGLANTKRLELQNIDNIVSAAEAQLIGLKQGKLYQKGQGMVESPQKAAERFIRQGIGAGKPFEGEPLLKKGLGKTKPFIEMPTTRAGEIRESVVEAAKAVRHPIEAVRKAGITAQPPSLPKAPAKAPGVLPIGQPPVEVAKPTAQKRTQAIDFVKSILGQEQFSTLDEKARIEIGQKMLAEQGVEVEAAELAETPPTEAKQAPQPTPTGRKAEIAPVVKQPWEMTKREIADKIGYKGGLKLSDVNRAVRTQVEESNRIQKEVNKEVAKREKKGMSREDAWDEVKKMEIWQQFITPTPDLNQIQNHSLSIRKALEQGKPVPAEVLAEYPDLAPVTQPKGIVKAKYDKASIQSATEAVKRTNPNEDRYIYATAEGFVIDKNPPLDKNQSYRVVHPDYSYEDVQPFAEGEEVRVAGRRKVLQERVRRGEPTPEPLLREFKSEKWAQEALARPEQKPLAPRIKEKEPKGGIVSEILSPRLRYARDYRAFLRDKTKKRPLVPKGMSIDEGNNIRERIEEEMDLKKDPISDETWNSLAKIEDTDPGEWEVFAEARPTAQKVHEWQEKYPVSEGYGIFINEDGNLIMAKEAKLSKKPPLGDIVIKSRRTGQEVDRIKVEPETQAPETKLIDSVVNHLETGKTLDAKTFFGMADEAYGGTRAEGKYGPSDVYDVLEVAVNKAIKKQGYTTLHKVEAAKTTVYDIENLLDKLPTQTNRSGEKDALQQFSTPPHYSYAVAWAANIGKDDIVLEPSAGTGSLAIHALNANPAKVFVNEISERRAKLLETLGFDKVFTEDAEQIHNILPEENRPTVILMNPPFSKAAARMGDVKVYGTDLKHIDAALAYLQEDGRLVAIMGRPMREEKGESAKFQSWLEQVKKRHNVRANVYVGRKIYKKYGTQFPTRVLIIDKTGPTTGNIVGGTVDTIPDLLYTIQGVRDDRQRAKAKSEPARKVVQEGVGEGKTRVKPTLPVQPATAPLDIKGERPDRQVGARPTATPRPSGADVRVEPAERPEDVAKEHRLGGPAKEKADRTGTTAPRKPGLKSESVTATTKEQERTLKTTLSESIFEKYHPAKFYLPGAQEHPASLVESTAMAAIDPPDIRYELAIPERLIKKGLLSNIQLEVVAYAGQTHEQMLPAIEGGTPVRKGYFIGDGTGVGKGREISGIILDNWNKGRKKAVWISTGQNLFDAAKRDWGSGGIQQNEKLLFNFKAGMKLKANQGILFTTYDTLKSSPRDKTKPKNLDQIVEWLGKDFDGVIAFDESHKMGNAMATQGVRGMTKASQRAIAGLELQSKLPNARILYVSATGATEVSNFAYAPRLGLWGPETPFANKSAFIAEMVSGGVANMELVARDMKALGVYTARSISYNDGTEKGTVTFERLVHKLSKEQRQIYDKMAEAWQVVLRNFEKALELTGATDDWRAKAAAASAFWGANQRFFNQVLTAIQTPSVINQIQKELDDGHSIVIQLTNTMEAAQERALAKLGKEQDLEDFDITPREVLMQLVEHVFPVTQFETYIDENGNQQARPVMDSKGNPILNREAVQRREALLDQLGSLKVSDSPLDMIINHFGPDKVAEVTGRSRRVVRKRQDDFTYKKVIEKRGRKHSTADINNFMDGKKRILIFSEAGGTGVSYHADNQVKNKQKRIHYVLQPGWRADTTLQGMGRTHRSDQAFAPTYVLVTTDLKGQMRFISSVARRLDQLGALTRGERKAGSAGLFTAADNLESKEAADALRVFFHDLSSGDIEGMDIATFGDETGLKLTDERGNLKQQLPDIRQFLNRLLSLKVDHQNQAFEAFEERLLSRVEQAITSGTLDQGTETYKADKIEKVSEETVYVHPQTGSETKYIKLKIYKKTHPTSWDNIQERHPFKYVQSKRAHNKIYAAFETHAATDATTGNIVERYRLVSPTGAYHFIERSHIDYGRENWATLKPDEAKGIWGKEYDNVPEFDTKEEHFLTGLLLPIWDKVRGKAKIYRVLTTEGEEMIGRTMHPNMVSTTLKALGVEREAPKLSPENAQSKILAGTIEVELSNQWIIRYAKVQGEGRLEIKGPDYTNFEELRAMGVYSERIQYSTRYFLPSTNAETIGKIMHRWPVVEINYLADSDPTIGTASPMGGFVGGRPATAQVSAIVKESMSTGSKNADMFLARTKGFTSSGQPWILRKVSGWVRDSFREFHYLPWIPKEPEYANIREHFRHTEEIATRASNTATEKMKWAIKPLEGVKQELRARFKSLEMKLIFDDLMEDADNALELPPQVTSADIKIAHQRAQGLYDKYPTVRNAYGRIREVNREIADMLIAEGMDPARAKEFYFPHKVIKYLRKEDGFFGIPSTRPADYKKGYLKQRKGGYDYSTDIMERLVEHWAQVIRDTEYTRFLNKVLKEEQANYFKKVHPEWREFTKDEKTGKRIRNMVPEGYKEVTVLPARAYYSINGVTEDLAKAIINQDLNSIEEMFDDSTTRQVRKVLALGRKRSYIIREPIARQIYDMPTMPISKNPIYLAVKGFNTFVKGQILFNPLYAVPFHVQNFIGDATKSLVALPSSLKSRYLVHYWQEVIAAHNGEKTDRFDSAQKFGVVGSGWVGTEIAELKTIMPEIEKAEISGASKFAISKVKHLFNLTRKIGSGREDWLRYAIFDRLMDLQEQGKDISKYAIKDSRMIGEISDPVARAAKVARDIAGDYKAIGKTGRALSDLLVPFYRWMHLNLPWWPRLVKEYAKKGQAGRLAYALLAAAFPYIAATLWNYSDDERRRFEQSLPPWKRWNFHINSLHGKKMYYVQLPLDDVLNFIGIPEDILDYQRYQRGMINAPELIKRIVINSTYEPGMSIVNSVGGLAAVVRDTIGWQTFPDLKDYRITDWKRKGLNVGSDIFGAPGQLGKQLYREGINYDPDTGEIILGQKTKDTLNRAWMGIRPYSVDVGQTKTLLKKSTYKRTNRSYVSPTGKKYPQVRGEAYRGKERLVDSLKIQLEKEAGKGRISKKILSKYPKGF